MIRGKQAGVKAEFSDKYLSKSLVGYISASRCEKFL
jgi:hypothetical protein